jgi:hypothetical protein
MMTVSFLLRDRVISSGVGLRLIVRRPTKVQWNRGLRSKSCSYNNSYHVIIFGLKERLKDFKHSALSIRKYKDRFNELVECFASLFNKDIKLFFFTCLHSSIKYDVKALKPYMLKKPIIYP